MDLLVKFDVPFSYREHLASLGLVTVAKSAYCVAADAELVDEVIKTGGNICAAPPPPPSI